MAKGFMDGYNTYDTSNGFGNARKWKSTFRQRMSAEEAETIIADQDLTPHQLLDVAYGATQEEIKKAFRAKMKEWHPDFNPHRIAEATVMAQRLNAAYEILKS